MTSAPSFPLDPSRAALLEAALQSALEGDAPALLTHAARYVLGWEDEAGLPSNAGGKRARPGLCIFTCEALGGTLEDALPGAVAVELIHNFSLVHDEIQDGDAERHGRPTTWRRFGAAQGINVGDFLYAAALSALVRGAGPAERRVEALAVLVTAVQEMVAGQWQDLSFESRDQVSRAEYLAMVAGKTGALIGAPVEIGALLAGAPTRLAARLGRWGKQVGLAFQAQDDYLGTWGDPAVTGKSNTGDIERRKKSLPVILGLADPAAREIILAEYGRPAAESPAVERVVAALEVSGAREETRRLAASLAAEADRMLDGAPLDRGVRELMGGIAHALVDRSA